MSDPHNANRAHIEKGGSINRPTPCTADGGVASAAPVNDLPPPLRGDQPLNSDPHRHGRNSNNLSQKPCERPGSHYTGEIRQRIFGRTVRYK
jgi:hypothetical protein